MKGRWAAGIVPRNFAWIVQDRLAVSERPGGYAPHHRRVRRQEEILWLEAHGFTRVVSLLPSQHNLHAYEELGLPSAHFGLPPQADVRDVLGELYPAMLGWIRDGERLLVHQEELGERVAGVVAGFLCWCGLLPDPPRATYAVEQLLRKQMGSAGRAIVALAPDLSPPAPVARSVAPVGEEGSGVAAQQPAGVTLVAPDPPATTPPELVRIRAASSAAAGEAAAAVGGVVGEIPVAVPALGGAAHRPAKATRSRKAALEPKDGR